MKTKTVESRESRVESLPVLVALPSLEKQTVRHVPLTHITPSPLQPRKEFDAEELADLRESIAAHGIQIPLLGRYRDNDTDGVELIAGERRWRAAKELKLETVPMTFWRKLAAMMLHREVDLMCGIDDEWLTTRGMKPEDDRQKDLAQLLGYINRQQTPHNLISFILSLQLDNLGVNAPERLTVWGVDWKTFLPGTKKAKQTKAKTQKPTKVKPLKTTKAKKTKPAKATKKGTRK